MSTTLFFIPCASNVFYAFQNSDVFARVVILLLLVLSVQAWTIMIEKWLFLRQTQRRMRAFIAAFADCETPLDMVQALERYPGPLARIYKTGISELETVLGVQDGVLFQQGPRFCMPRSLKAYEVDRVRSMLERTVTSLITETEERLPFLGTVVTVSPFLGLLGTVWGVMMAFSGMAQAGRPDITAMAPGVSGALLTTVVGLLVAIPSVIGFNFITNAVKQIIAEMDSFVEDFVSLVRIYTATENPFVVDADND
jgi:biopolymer transport protein ExbB/TolQ